MSRQKQEKLTWSETCGSTHPCQNVLLWPLQPNCGSTSLVTSTLSLDLLCKVFLQVTEVRPQLIDRPTLFQSDSFYILRCPARPYMLLSSTPLAHFPPVLASKTDNPLPKTQTHVLMTKMLPVIISCQLITRAAHQLSVNLMWFNPPVAKDKQSSTHTRFFLHVCIKPPCFACSHISLYISYIVWTIKAFTHLMQNK